MRYGVLGVCLAALACGCAGSKPFEDQMGWHIMKIDDVRKTNELLRKECEAQGWMKFLDTTTPLIGADGQPRAECFIPGNIHMTPEGYKVWTHVVAPVVVEAEKKFELR